jgi:hypothetical protein
MAVHDKIRLTGLLRKNPASAGFFYARGAADRIATGYLARS